MAGPYIFVEMYFHSLIHSSILPCIWVALFSWYVRSRSPLLPFRSRDNSFLITAGVNARVGGNAPTALSLAVTFYTVNLLICPFCVGRKNVELQLIYELLLC